MGKVYPFCMKKCADDLGTFVANIGYHYDEGSVLRILVPRLAAKTNQRLPSFVGARAATTSASLRVDVGILVAGELQTAISSLSKCGWAAHLA